MVLKIGSEISSNQWRELLKSSPFSSPFQTPELYNFFNSVEGFSAEVFAVAKDSELLNLVVVTVQKEKGIKGFFSRRGIIYGGPLFKNSSDNQIMQLLDHLIEYYRSKLIYIEIRNYFDFALYITSFTNTGFKFIPWLNFHLDIDSPNQMKKNMSSSRLRQIKKAQKNGVSWKVAEKSEDVISFYQILSNLFKMKIKKPIFPLKFFIKLFEAELGKFLLVYYDNKVIGGILCLIAPKKAIYEFYVCGLDNEYKEQYPSVMATWAAMEYASQNSIPVFDFMGAGSPDEDYGVREFKSRFGGRLVEYGRFLKILNPFLYQFGKLGLVILSKIK